MNFHFFPQVPGLETTVTLANFAPIEESGTGPEIAHVIWSDGSYWRAKAISEVAPGTLLRVGRSMLPDTGRGLPFLYLNREPLAETLECPPVDRRRDTAPAWRANIRFAGATTSTSFQGEYPSAMAGIAVGTLLSIAPMSRGTPGVETLLLVVNMRPDPTFGDARLRFVDLARHTVIGETEAAFNRLTIVDLGALAGTEDCPIAVVSPDMTGIPLYLSRDAAGRHLSLEHSHPPAESVVFGARDEVQRAMKRWWLEASCGSDAMAAP